MANAVVSDEEAMTADEIEDVNKQAASALPVDIVTESTEAYWDTEANSDGVIEATMLGMITFKIHEGVDEEGNPVYTSTMFRKPQDELQGALSLGFKNAALRAFRAQWDVLFPPEPKERKVRDSLKAKLERAEQLALEAQESKAEVLTRAEIAEKQSAELVAAINENRMPDFVGLGIPAPLGWTD